VQKAAKHEVLNRGQLSSFNLLKSLEYSEDVIDIVRQIDYTIIRR